MLFCPTCGNLLMVESGPLGRTRFCCQTCPYIHPMERGSKITRKVVLKRKAVDDILGGEDAWANVDKTETTCPFCNHKEAYFFMAQLRSADEPMTCFYKCTACKQRWKE
ncbi:unnamed protein product [Choristocarpus tenellus]